MGLLARANQVFDFLYDAQTAYAKQSPSNLTGPFMPVFIWPRWDNLDYSDNADSFSFAGPDPNTFWGGFQARPVEAAARCWYEWPEWQPQLQPPPAARKIVARFMRFLGTFMRREGVFNSSGAARHDSSRLGLCESCTLRRRRGCITGHPVAALSALKSSLQATAGATAGGKRP